MSVDQIMTSQIILSNPAIKDIFKFISNARLVSRYEINSKQSVPKEVVEDALSKLENSGLIEKQSAPIEAFDKFYPTGSGLTVEKMIR